MTVPIKNQVVVVPVNPKLLGLETEPSKNAVILDDTMANTVNESLFGSEEAPIICNGQIIVPIFLSEDAVCVFEVNGRINDLFEKCWKSLFELERRHKQGIVQIWLFASWETCEKFLTFSGDEAYFLRPELIVDRNLFFIQESNQGVGFNPILQTEELIWFQ